MVTAPIPIESSLSFMSFIEEKQLRNTCLYRKIITVSKVDTNARLRRKTFDNHKKRATYLYNIFNYLLDDFIIRQSGHDL